jgi:hypothetical protein
MKRKYNTLNEEVNRMKSLFGESRLYGNLVSNGKTNLITEAGPGKRFFAKNLAKAFSVTLKTFEDLGNFTKFLNREINSVDDMIKHVDDFPVIWKAIADKTDFAAVRRNLLLLKKMESKNLFKGRSKESMDIILDGFPPEGGMKDMVFDMWLVANGKSKNLPAVIDTRIAVIDPKSGELVIGKQNTETGVVVGINKNGEVVTVQNPKGEWKKGDDIIDMERTDIEGEFVDFEEIPNGTPLDDLNGKTVAGTEENVEAVLEATEKAAIEETKQGNKVVFTITGEGEDGVKAAQEMMDDITGGNKKSMEEVSEEMVDEIPIPEDIPKEEIPNWKQKMKEGLKKKLYSLGYHTRYWWNFHTIGEKISKQNVAWADRRTGQIVLRTLVLWPLTIESLSIATDEDKDLIGGWDNNFVVHLINDVTNIVNDIRNAWGDGPQAMTEKILEDSILNLSDKKIAPSIIKKDVETAAMNELLYIGTDSLDENGKRRSTLTCEKLVSMNSDGDVIGYILDKHSGIIITREVKKIQNDSGISTDEFKEIQKKLTSYLNMISKNRKSNNDYIKLVQLSRKNCIEKMKGEESHNEFMKDDYEVTFIKGDSTAKSY